MSESGADTELYARCENFVLEVLIDVLKQQPSDEQIDQATMRVYNHMAKSNGLPPLKEPLHDN